MRDARLRILATILLSAGSFISIYGALAAFVWWLIFTPRLKAIAQPRMLAGAIAMIAATAIVSEVTGGLGVFYLFRMIPILLIAAWAFSDRQDNELLHVSVWLMGKKTGFDIGLTAEMGLQSLQLINRDVMQINQAMTVKGLKPSFRTIVPLATTLLINQLRRTEETAKLLTIRGFVSGGEIHPLFITEKRDVVLAVLSLFILVFSILIQW